MIELIFTNPVLFIIIAIALVLSLSLHEAAHAFAADHLGDPTPRSQGRTTLNPLSHLDPIGTLLLFIFSFGWGKPVQFDPYNLKNPRKDSALISLAGPATNIAIAILAAFLNFIISTQYFAPVFYIFIELNITLAVFNLVPIHPLDGAKILSGYLPRELSYEYENIMQKYGTLILVILILPFNGKSAIFELISPIIYTLTNLLIF